MAEPAIQPINLHTTKSSLDWLFNILVQPSTGTGSGSTPETGEHFKLSLDLLRQALVEVTNVVDNLTTTIPGKVLDARQGKVLADAIQAILDQKATANGIASLGADGKIPAAQIPAIAIVEVFPVESQAEMLALDAQQGDMAIRSDVNKVFILSASPASTLENWIELSALKALVDAAIADLAGAGRTTETVKKNADDIATLNGSEDAEGSVAHSIKTAVDAIDENFVTTDEYEYRLDVELSYLVKYQILHEKNVIGSYNTVLTRFDSDLVAIWERADIVLTGFPCVQGTKLYCPTSAGIYVVSVDTGTTITLLDAYDNCTCVASLGTNRIYSTYLTTNHAKSLILWVNDIETASLEIGSLHIVRTMENFERVNSTRIYTMSIGSGSVINSHDNETLAVESTSSGLYHAKMFFLNRMYTYAMSYHANGTFDVLSKSTLGIVSSSRATFGPPHSEYVLNCGFSPNGVAYLPNSFEGLCVGIDGSGSIKEILPAYGSYRASALYDGGAYLYVFYSGNAGTEQGRTRKYARYKKLYKESDL